MSKQKRNATADTTWLPALIAFYERDCLPQKAENLRRGAPLDYLDRRAIEALRAAFDVARAA